MSTPIITFCGTALFYDDEGTYRFVPGSRNRVWNYVHLPRAQGELAKDLGVSGATHTLTLNFLNLDTNDVATVFSRVVGAQSPTSGALVVPRYGTYNHCVVDAVSFSEQELNVVSVSKTTPKGTSVDRIEVTITFRQLRA